MTKTIEPENWHFDSIPDQHLIACCYWEYARESRFLRELKNRCVELNRTPRVFSETFQTVGKDARTVMSIGPVANSFLLGFGFDPAATDPASYCTAPRSGPITGRFPAPWQSLSADERDYRAQLASTALTPAGPPFRRAAGSDALSALQFLTSTALSSLRSASPHDANRFPQDQLDRLNSHADPRNALEKPRLLARQNGAPAPSAPAPAAQPALLRLDHHGRPAEEIGLFEIDWAQSTDQEIVDCFRAWIKANRPAGVRHGPGRGQKLKDWRAHLTRLAVMRLLARFSALDLHDPRANHVPGLWETKQFSGSTWLDIVKWHDARREARQIFHQLFPFLPPDHAPLSWPTSRSRPKLIINPQS